MEDELIGFGNGCGISCNWLEVYYLANFLSNRTELP